jgi:hypothetical protein
MSKKAKSAKEKPMAISLLVKDHPVKEIAECTSLGL